eukprot:GILJ01011849.1.p1 GENE.GILJ01011849.1~~GILJ01011849.1.p1  ORF type:complete len:136 (+),score=16.28 GILJ01011849.1:39-446(+)
MSDQHAYTPEDPWWVRATRRLAQRGLEKHLRREAARKAKPQLPVQMGPLAVAKRWLLFSSPVLVGIVLYYACSSYAETKTEVIRANASPYARQFSKMQSEALQEVLDNIKEKKLLKDRMDAIPDPMRKHQPLPPK